MRSLNYGWTRASTRTGVICSGRTELLVVLLCQSHQKCFASGQALQPISSNHALCWILQVSPNMLRALLLLWSTVKAIQVPVMLSQDDRYPWSPIIMDLLSDSRLVAPGHQTWDWTRGIGGVTYVTFGPTSTSVWMTDSLGWDLQWFWLGLVQPFWPYV